MNLYHKNNININNTLAKMIKNKVKNSYNKIKYQIYKIKNQIK